MGPDAQLREGHDRAAALDWLLLCNEMARELRLRFERYATFDERRVHVGRGAGGDNTLVIDAEAEDAVFAVLEREAAAGAAFTALSEERGEVDFGGDDVLVVIDPIDGSLNAKRAGLSYSLSVAVARGGRTMADVFFGYVYDFGSDETWHAVAGDGAFLDGRRLDPSQAGNGLEVVGLESTKPAFMPPELIEYWSQRVNRLRSIGSIALTLCQVAAARFDGMCSLRPCRSVDAAAGQLIVREAGGEVAFGELDALHLAPLSLEPYRHPVAARDRERVRFLLDGLALTGEI
jgi:myo-inositol-1(or 4)-monophosphatase